MGAPGLAISGLGLLCMLAACGSRTGLLVDETPGAPPAGTASSASRSTAPGCADASAPSIFVVTDSGRLYRFDPPGSFQPVGTLSCPIRAPDQSPFSMAVSRSGIAYILYKSDFDPSADGEIFVASTVDASCQATPFVPGQNGFVTRFGMGFASNAPAAGETLYVAASGQLATIDTNTFALRVIAQSPVLYSAELTGTDSGQLYAFFQSSFTAIAQVDKTTGYVPQLWTFNLPFNDNWAFAAWKGAFYTFTGLDPQQQLGTVVNRFDPSTDTLTPVSVLEPDAVVGAGVSTCAPGG